MGHAATMQKFFERVNAGDLDGFIDLVADDFVEHEPIQGPPTKEGVKQFFQAYMAAFPDLRMDVEDVLESGDKAVARVRITGTHESEFLGVPPTGRRIDVQGIDIVRFGDDGRAVEHWGVTDAMTMMQQLGVVPEGPPA